MVFETCGRAFGFALAAAAREGEDLRKNAGLLAFAHNLDSLIEDERFSPDASLALQSVSEGISAFVSAGTAPGEFL